MVYCAANGCKNKSQKGNGVCFFNFPKDENLRKTWTDYCRRANFVPRPGHRLCSDHFTLDNFEMHPEKLKEIGFQETYKARLKPTAYPDVPIRAESENGNSATSTSTTPSLNAPRKSPFKKRKAESNRRSSMSSSRDSSSSREDLSGAKRRSIGTRAHSKEPEEEATKKDGRPIRTRLSTGSIHMNGTTTVAVAKEIENNTRLMAKDSPSGLRKKKSIAISDGPRASSPPPKKRKIGRNDGTGEDNRNDYFCWLCHKEGTVVCCELCPRVYHSKCLELDTDLPKEWVCPECEVIMRAECVETRSTAMSIISVDTLCSLLGFALERMKHQGTEPFMKPVDPSSVLHYTDYIFNPMDLTMLEQNIKKKMYGCTEAFLADAKWILHNCIIFNGTHHKLTASAKMIIKICKHEMAEIELCPDCYWNSCVRKNEEWFAELCRSPHTLVWAKLKGYPFWPAKVLREVDGNNVDVRFFGAHDRSLLPTSQVFLLSKNIPTPAKNKKGGFDYSMQELELHIQKLEQKYGSYEYAPFRCPYDRKNVYKEGKFKVSPKKRLTKASIKFGPSALVLQRQKSTFASDSKQTDKQTALSKTASAVKNKYNSIITTRRASNLGGSVENSPVKGDSKGAGNSPVKSPAIISESSVISANSSQCDSSVDEDKCVTTVSEEIDKTSTDPSNTEPKPTFCIISKLKTRLQGKSVESGESKDNESAQESNKNEPIKVEITPTSLPQNDENSCESSDSSKQKNRKEKRKQILENISVKLKQIVDDFDSNQSEKSVNENNDGNALVKLSASDQDKLQENVKLKSTVGEKDEKVEPMDTTDLKLPEEKLTPSKKDYLSKLEETIKKGKENLGIIDDSNDLEEASSSEDEGNESEEEDDSDDNDESDNEKVEESTSERVDSEKDSESKSSVDNDGSSQGNTISENSNQSADSTEKQTVIRSPTTGTIIEREYETTKNESNDTTGPMKHGNSEQETKEDAGLMMEVETESDTDKLVIDTDDDRTLSPSPKKSASIPNQETSKTSTIECTPSTSPKTIPLPKPKSPVDETASQTDLHSDFFQSAVEKTLKQKPIVEPIVPPVTKKLREIVPKTILSVPTASSGIGSSKPATVKSPTGTSQSSSPKLDETRSGLITNFTQKIMGPIQTAFTEFFTQVLEQERESMKKELTKSSDKLAQEDKPAEKPSEVLVEESRRHWEYSQQITELKYNFRLTCMEMKSSWESEKTRLIDEVKELMKKEKESAINETKKKQWCAKCGKEAIFYCCWNTSYCDYPCQQAHWPTHMSTCMQQTNENDPNKNQPPANQPGMAANQNVQNRTNGQQPPSKSPMEIEQTEYQRRQQEQQHQQFNVQPNGGYISMHTSPPGIMHNLHRQQESPPNTRKKQGTWTDQDMSNAVAAVNYGGMSINKAAKVYNVPRNKITERVSKMPPTMNQPMMSNNHSQLQMQYVQPPQPMSVPPSVQSHMSPPQMRMPSSQQPIITNMMQPNQPVMSQNNSILFPVQLRPNQPPMNIPPGIIQPGQQLVISQGGQPPRPNMMPRYVPNRFH